MTKIAKRIKAARKGIDRIKLYGVDEAVKLVQERARAKFDESVEIAMNLGVDPKHADQMVRGVVSLPSGSGRTMRVAVFAKGAKAEEAKKAGADLVKTCVPRCLVSSLELSSARAHVKSATELTELARKRRRQ